MIELSDELSHIRSETTGHRYPFHCIIGCPQKELIFFLKTQYTDIKVSPETKHQDAKEYRHPHFSVFFDEAFHIIINLHTP